MCGTENVKIEKRHLKMGIFQHKNDKNGQFYFTYQTKILFFSMILAFYNSHHADKHKNQQKELLFIKEIQFDKG